MSRRNGLLFILMLAISLAVPAHAAPPQISAAAAQQIQVLKSIKMSRSGPDAKIGSRLYRAILHQRGDPRLQQLPDMRYAQPEADGRMLLDAEATSAEGIRRLVKLVPRLGGSVENFQVAYRSLRLRLPLAAVTSFAASADVRRVHFAARLTTQAKRDNAPPGPAIVNVSAGDVAHRADQARSAFGVSGVGVKICAISTGVDSLAQSQSTGDLPPDVDVLPGQAGYGAEGTAMLEIVHDLAPGATLGFATALGSEAQFAQNILDLRTSGCDIIVDDVEYFGEPVFQDGPVADAVNQVAADGALYFSSAGNGGNVNDGTSGTWEGDFLPNGTPVALAGAGPVNNFGDGGQSLLVTGSSYGLPIVLQWNDPFGASANDYDLYAMDGALTTIYDASTNVQNGDDDPIEVLGPPGDGERLVVAQASGVGRMIDLRVFGGQVQLQTTGCTRNHSSALGAFSVAAVDVADAGGVGGVFDGSEPVETFSCDGPRRMFFDASGAFLPGAPLGDYTSAGGVVRSKPDIAAADGVATSVPGFDPFYGTSAAAPHAAAIAGLAMQAFPAYTPAQILAALKDSALDIDVPGVDNDSGSGIVMAYQTLASVATLIADPAVPTQIAGDGDANIEPNEDWALILPLHNMGAAAATAVSATLASGTPGVTILAGQSTYPDIAPSASAANDPAYFFHVDGALPCGTAINFSLTVTYGDGASSRTFNYRLGVGGAGTSVTFSYLGPVVPIPLGLDSSGTRPGAPADAIVPVSGVGLIHDANLSIDGDTCTSAPGATTVGIAHAYVSNLAISLISPDGMIRMLVDHVGGNGVNFCQTVLDDEGGGPSIQSVTSAQAPFSGSFTPDPPLAAFHGAHADGNWTLRAQDFYPYYAGNIRKWSLEMTPSVCDAPAQPAQLSATKSVTGGDLLAGGSVIYTVTLTNTGTGIQPDNSGDEFSDLLPDGLTLGTPTASAGTISGIGDNPVTWNGILMPGALVTLTIPATIAPGTVGQVISNQATVNFDNNRDGSNSGTALSDDPDVGGTNDPTVFFVHHAELVITPATLDFGDQAVAVTSAPRTVTLQNSGNAPLTISAVTDPSVPFALASSSTCAALPITLAPTESCALEYTFTPTATGLETQTLDVTSDGDGMASFQLSGTGVPGAPASITITAGDAQSATINTPFAVPLDVKVSDANDIPVQHVDVTFAAPTSGAGAVLTGSSGSGAIVTVSTDASGHAQVGATANSVAGSYQVLATATGVSAPAMFALTNTAGSVDRLVIISGDAQTATTGTAFTLPLTVQVLDAGNNPLAGVSVDFHAPPTGASAVLSTTSVTTDSNGVANISATANAETGSYVVTAMLTTSRLESPQEIPDSNYAVDFLLENTAPDVALSIDIDDGRDFARYGHIVDYLVTVGNTGVDAAHDVTVAMTLPTQLDATFATWICVDSSSGACTASGSGALNDSSVAVPAGGSVSYIFSAPVRSEAAGDGFAVDVSGTSPDEPAGVSFSDFDLLTILRNGFEFHGLGAGSNPLVPLGAPFRPGQTLNLVWPPANADLLDAVVIATSANGSGFRIERLQHRKRQWLRLVAVAVDTDERFGDWLPVAAGASVTVTLVGASGSRVLDVSGATRPATLWLGEDASGPYTVRASGGGITDINGG